MRMVFKGLQNISLIILMVGFTQCNFKKDKSKVNLELYVSDYIKTLYKLDYEFYDNDGIMIVLGGECNEFTNIIIRDIPFEVIASGFYTKNNDLKFAIYKNIPIVIYGIEPNTSILYSGNFNLDIADINFHLENKIEKNKHMNLFLADKDLEYVKNHISIPYYDSQVMVKYKILENSKRIRTIDGDVFFETLN